MKTIKIFLASSGELQEERKEISSFIREKNDRLITDGIYLKLIVWEELLHSFSGDRVQSYFNEEMLQCDIVIALFYKKVGKFSKEEFNIAYKKLKIGNKPKYILVFFKIDPNEKISKDIIRLKEEIERYEQLYNTFESIDGLILKLNKQLRLIIEKKDESHKQSRNRRIDAALPEYAKINEKIDLIVQVRFTDSPFLENSDFPTKQKPFSIERMSDTVNIDFPVNRETNELNAAYLFIKVIESDCFRIEGSLEKKIEVPPDKYSNKIMFYLIPLKEGICRINIEVYNVDKNVYLGTIPVETIFNQTLKSSNNLISQFFINVKVADDYLIPKKNVFDNRNTPRLQNVKISGNYIASRINPHFIRDPNVRRKLRVHLAYEIYNGDTIEKKELPFIVGVIGDFTGYVYPDNPLKPLKERYFKNINRDNFNQRLKTCSPRINCKVENTVSFELTEEDIKDIKTKEISDDIIEKLKPMLFSKKNKLFFTDKNKYIEKLKETLGKTEDSIINSIMDTVQKKLFVDVTFDNINDFRPDKVALKIPELKKLVDKREHLIKMLVKMEIEPELQNWLDQIVNDKSIQEQLSQELQQINISKNKTPLLKQMILEDRMAEEDNEYQMKNAKATISSFVQVLMENNASISLTKEEMIMAKIEEINQLLQKQLNLIIHHPDFQKLESSWRGLHYLVMQSETGEFLKILFLDSTKDELEKDLSSTTYFDQSDLYKKVYTNVDQYGGVPFGILIGDYEFRNHSQDIDILTKLSYIAATANTPFISSASPQLFGLENFSELNKLRNLSKIFEGVDYVKWRDLRICVDSRYVVLTLPHILMRMPYGENTDPIYLFPFEEDVTGEDNKKFLWGNAGYALGIQITDAFAKYGWFESIRGSEINWLPKHNFQTERGEIYHSTDIILTQRFEIELCNLGFAPLICLGTNHTAFFGIQTINEPYVYEDEDENFNVKLSSQLQYTLCIARVAHYLKYMLRDKVGSFQSPNQIAKYLDSWLHNYVCLYDTSEEVMKKRPFKSAGVEVQKRAGYFHITAYITPYSFFDDKLLTLKTLFKCPLI